VEKVVHRKFVVAAVKQAEPKVKIEGLEQLLVKQQAGQLSEFVKSAMSGCKSDK
jgi:hypothetical protein